MWGNDRQNFPPQTTKITNYQTARILNYIVHCQRTVNHSRIILLSVHTFGTVIPNLLIPNIM